MQQRDEQTDRQTDRQVATRHIIHWRHISDVIINSFNFDVFL